MAVDDYVKLANTSMGFIQLIVYLIGFILIFAILKKFVGMFRAGGWVRTHVFGDTKGTWAETVIKKSVKKGTEDVANSVNKVMREHHYTPKDLNNPRIRKQVENEAIHNTMEKQLKEVLGKDYNTFTTSIEKQARLGAYSTPEISQIRQQLRSTYEKISKLKSEKWKLYLSPAGKAMYDAELKELLAQQKALIEQLQKAEAKPVPHTPPQSKAPRPIPTPLEAAGEGFPVLQKAKNFPAPPNNPFDPRNPLNTLKAIKQLQKNRPEPVSTPGGAPTPWRMLPKIT